MIYFFGQFQPVRLLILLGIKAKKGYQVSFTTLGELFMKLSEEVKRYTEPDLMIIDDL